MNSCILSGRVSNIYFDVINGQQPFLCFLLRVPGPRQEGYSTARIVVYGDQAQHLYPILEAGAYAEVQGRFRHRSRENGYATYEFVARHVNLPRALNAPGSSACEDEIEDVV